MHEPKRSYAKFPQPIVTLLMELFKMAMLLYNFRKPADIWENTLM